MAVGGDGTSTGTGLEDIPANVSQFRSDASIPVADPTRVSTAVIDQHHPLFLQPSDTPGSSLISIKLIGYENYALWSSSMRVSLLGKSKVGFVDGRYSKDKFDVSLHELWEKCNAIVLSWIMNPMRTELLSGMVYATSAHKVWSDLRESFEKVNGSRVLYLHKQIATLSQGISSLSSYFAKLKELWAEFDARMPCPGCGCEESKRYVEHFEYQRMLQLLMGLNESYAQSSNQILNMSSISSINKAYSMIITEESRRSLANHTINVSEVHKGTALFTNKNHPNQAQFTNRIGSYPPGSINSNPTLSSNKGVSQSNSNFK
ncbi:uncharacterized protein [Nicotiana sylvestris]|uniref:uncharacterized protein n=1 Tax=Nicotiana sylvestris TaxID=4096 RepID=UPI00388C9E15